MTNCFVTWITILIYIKKNAIIIAMKKSIKPVRLSEHAKNQLKARGTSKEENEIVVVTVYVYYS